MTYSSKLHLYYGDFESLLKNPGYKTLSSKISWPQVDLININSTCRTQYTF